MDFKLLVGASGGNGIETAKAAALGIDSSFLPSLTMKQRVTGFVVTFSLGMVISMLATLSITSPVRFGTLYTFGNLLSLSSTALLFGPWRQLQNMFHRKRVLATLMYLASLGGTLAVAITTGSVVGTIIMIVIQFLCLVWYTMSYIPFARDMAKKMIGGCLSRGG